MPQEPDLPDDLRWICKRSASILDGPTLGNQIDALVDEVPRIGARARGSYRVLWVDDKSVTVEHFAEALRVAAGSDTEPKVVLRGAAKLRIGEVKQVMLAIEEAGFHGVGLIAKPAVAKTGGN